MLAVQQRLASFSSSDGPHWGRLYQQVTNALHTKEQLASDGYLATDELQRSFSEGLFTYSACFVGK